MDYLVVMCYDEAAGPYANSNAGYTRTAYGTYSLFVSVFDAKSVASKCIFDRC